MKKPLVIKNESEIIISFNGKKLIIAMEDKYKNMSELEIANNFLTKRNVKC